MSGISIDALDVTELNRKFDKLKESIDMGGPGVRVMEKVGEAIMRDIDERFSTGGYGEWAPLTLETIKDKDGNSNILMNTGNLRSSVRIGYVTDSTVFVEIPYGGANNDRSVPARIQEGTDTTPARKIIDTSTPQFKAKIDAVIAEWLDELVSDS